eukprot:scaffold10576_cov115-Isochrysis_galbana.AAC.3
MAYFAGAAVEASELRSGGGWSRARRTGIPVQVQGGRMPDALARAGARRLRWRHWLGRSPLIPRVPPPLVARASRTLRAASLLCDFARFTALYHYHYCLYMTIRPKNENLEMEL